MAITLRPKSIIHNLLRLYDLRSVVVVLAYCLVVSSSRPEFLLGLDKWIFELGAQPNQLGFDVVNQVVQVGWSSIWMLFQADAPASISWLQWFPCIEISLLVLITTLLIVGFPKWGAAWGSVFGVAVVTGLLITQIGMWAFKQVWIPLGASIQFVVAGCLIMLLWLKPYQQKKALLHSRNLLAKDHAVLLLQKGQLTEAANTLSLCIQNAEVNDLYYQIALQQERKRQYDEAVQTYQLIIQHSKGYRDSQERLSHILKLQNNVSLEKTYALAGGATLNKTLPLTNNGDTGLANPILGRYEVLRELGRGAMGVVFLGKDPKLSRYVAIKTLNYAIFDDHQLDELRERFFREAEAAGRLSHPHIVTVYDVGEETDVAYIAMDYIDGFTLDRFTRLDDLLPVSKVFELMAQVAEALAYAHDHSIIHRDIKPSNLLFDKKTEQVKVSDFGIARFSNESRTRTGQVMGSPLYMSPEQLKGQTIKGTSDLFSLGVTMYQLLTGITPFAADSLPELTLQVINKKQTSVREIRPELPASAVRIINKALQKDPAKRYQSAQEMAEQLRKAQAIELKREVA